MKYKLVSAFFLLLCFSCLAILSGAVPVLAQRNEAPPPGGAGAGEIEADALPAQIDPAPAGPQDAAELYDGGELPDEADGPEGADELYAVPEPEPVPAQDPAGEAEVPMGSGPRIVTTTLAAEELLDNDTYYEIDPQALLEEELSLTLPAEGYQILIIHTHSTEAYTPTAAEAYESSGDYRTADIRHSVVRVGQELASALEAYGLHVLHDTALYDYPSYNGSYARSGEAVEAYLNAYPGIRLVIDLHRDAIGDEEVIYRTVAEAEGVQAAQMMFVMGSDVNLEHPGWRENLKLALALQSAVRRRWPDLMRPTVLCDYRYNQQLTTGSLLLEVGTTGNTLEEAIRAVKLFADAVGPFLVNCEAELRN